ncbi:MAG: division/cell wall cluster transcriptional repressor MraZ [Cytophagales bacterium]|nr:division/cell wall cluster transcriptional repressor MraZ [Cytophagales bacterium]
MLEYASLEKEGVIVGLGDRLEIWNPKAYRSVQDEDIDTLEQEFLIE